jgi:hypothetical protein
MSYPPILPRVATVLMGEEAREQFQRLPKSIKARVLGIIERLAD